MLVTPKVEQFFFPQKNWFCEVILYNMVCLGIPYVSTTRPSHWRRGLETCQTSNPKRASFLF